MVQKIILFLSDLKSEAPEKEYTCPDKKKVLGAQTNDAPVRYLLRSSRAVREVICVVTELAKQSALEHFERMVHEAAPQAKIVTIPYEEDQDFSQTAIPAILDKVKRGDKIYLDVTGGFRNANMHLLLLSRVLSYIGVHTAGAVYSNFKTSTVEDVSHLFRLFDLVGGMQELTSLGSVQTLRRYYEAEPGAQDPAVKEVIDCMARLTEDITLCHTAQIEQRMDAFNDAMKGARKCSDPLMRQLLGAFRRTFGQKMTTEALIRWCVGNDMIPQALTVYTERIPDVIMNGEILRREPWVEDVPKRAYENQATVQFLRGFLMLANRPNLDEVYCAELCVQLREYVQNNAPRIREMVRGRAAPALQPKIAVGVENIVLVARLAYPDGCFNPSWADGLPPEKADLRRLEERLNRSMPGTVRNFVNSVRTFSEDYFRVLLELGEKKEKEEEDADNDTYSQTLRQLPELLPGSGYAAECSVEQLAQVSRDYLYIKALRNQVNHANEKSTIREQQLKYLEECGYTRPEDLSLSDIKAAVLTALDNLQQARERKEEA